MPITAKLCIPIMAPLPPERELRALHEECLKELRELKQLPSINPELGGIPITVRLLQSPEEDRLVKKRWKPRFQIRTYSLLTLSVDATGIIEHARRSWAWSGRKFTANEKELLYRQYALSILQHDANLLLLAANIARPGALSGIEGYAFLRGRYQSSTKAFFAEDLFRAVEVSKEVGWPRLPCPSLQQAWHWLANSGAVVEGVGVGRLGRALSALSHLTTETLSNTSTINLVWILLGLESLYSRGNAGLKEQLLGKTERVVGPRTENKKLFGAVYDFRSRLIHGDVDIPMRFSEFDGVDRFKKYHSELYRNEEIALAVLLGTLQWMVLHGAHHLEFEYALKDL